MARQKVKLAYIVNARARKVTFNKRRKGLMKKVSELSTLCQVSACAIVNGPYDRQPCVWPAQEEAQSVLTRFMSIPEMERNKKQFNPESYMDNQIAKMEEQLKKLEQGNRDMEINEIYNLVLAGKCSVTDIHRTALGDLYCFCEEMETKIHRKLCRLSKAPTSSDDNNTAPNPNANTIGTDVPGGGVNGSGIYGSIVPGGGGGGGIYCGVVNHHNQVGGGGAVIGSGGQEMIPSYQMRAASMGALQSQPWFMNPPSVPHPADQMMMGGGVLPPQMQAPYNGGTLGDIFNNFYVPMNNI